MAATEKILLYWSHPQRLFTTFVPLASFLTQLSVTDFTTRNVLMSTLIYSFEVELGDASAPKQYLFAEMWETSDAEKVLGIHFD